MARFQKSIYLSVFLLLTCLCRQSSVQANTKVKAKKFDLNKIAQVNPKKIDRQEKSLPKQWEQAKDRRSHIHANNIEDLQDIQPSDWSYQALKDLIERYDCLSGFPDDTYRGEQTVSRDEFAAGLNACLNKLEASIKNSQITSNDVDTFMRLMQEYQSELAVLQGKTDGSQARLIDLEATQFSTTSKLQGEAVFSVGDLLSGGESNSILGSRVRLDIVSSFKGDDLLFTRLSRGNFTGFVNEANTFQGDLAFADRQEDDVRLDKLYYSFSVGDRLNFLIGGTGVEAEDIAPTIGFLDGDGGSGAISTFGTRNPLYFPPGDAGIGISHRPLEQIELSAGYLASSADDSTTGNGLFNGDYSALGQITFTPAENLNLAATYVHSFNQTDTETGTAVANLRSLTSELFGSSVPTIGNSYGLELSWSISDRFIVGGRGGLSKVSTLNTLEGIDGGTLDIWNWAATLAIPDLGKVGSLAGIVIGREPQVTNSTIDNIEEDSEQSLHLEAFYQYQLNDNLAITPGIVWITKPDSPIEDAEDLAIGTVRTTFSF